MSKTIAVDFDGVIHSYITPFCDVPPDKPVDGAIQFLRDLLESSEYKVAILSTRNLSENGPENIRKYLLENGLSKEEVDKISIPSEKIKAHLYIDDRGWRFEGKFPTIDQIRETHPWNKPMREAAEALIAGAQELKESGIPLKDIVKLLKDA